MAFKKNWLTDLIWAVTAAIIGLNIVGYVKMFLMEMPELEALRTDSSVLYDAIWLGGSAVVMGTLVLIFFLGRLFIRLFSRNSQTKNQVSFKRKICFGVLEGILLLCIVVGAFFVRYYVLVHTLEWKLADDFYYELAMIKINDTLPSLTHTGSYWYIFLLSFVMRILGNKVFSAVVLQFVLQMVTILFLYFGMRRLAGVIPAVVSCIAFAVAYSNCALLFEADAQCFVFFLFTVAVYFTAGLFELYRKDVGSAGLVFRIIMAAFFSGLCCFVEPYCMMILLFGVALALQDSEWYNGKTKACLFLSYIIATVAVSFVFFTVTAVANNVDLAMAIADWVTSLTDAKPIHYALYFEENAFRTTAEGIVLVCLAFLNLPGYHVSERAKQIPFLILLVLAPVPFCTMGVLEYDLFSLWIWAALAGIGLQLVVSPRTVAVAADTTFASEEQRQESFITENTSEENVSPAKEEMSEEDDLNPGEIFAEDLSAEDGDLFQEDIFAEDRESQEENIFAKDMEKPEEEKEDSEESVNTEDCVFIEKVISPKEQDVLEDETSSEEDMDFMDEAVERTEPKSVKYLHNPLPVPKKHVKRVADFSVHVVEDDDFDFDTFEDDDFDL